MKYILIGSVLFIQLLSAGQEDQEKSSRCPTKKFRLVMVTTQMPGPALTYKREQFIKQFNELSTTEKIKVCRYGIYNDPQTGHLREEFSDLTDEQRQQIIESKQFQFPDYDDYSK